MSISTEAMWSNAAAVNDVKNELKTEFWRMHTKLGKSAYKGNEQEKDMQRMSSLSEAVLALRTAAAAMQAITKEGKAEL